MTHGINKLASGLPNLSVTEALDAEAQAKMKKTGISELRISRLPTPSIHYQPFLPIEPDCSICALALLGESKNNILLFLDEAGNTCIYNTELSSLTATPILNSPKDADCVAVSIPDSQVLGYDSMGKWRWSELPPPPFLEDREYEVPLMTNFTVVDGTRIYSGPYDLCTLDNLSTAPGSPPPTMQHIGEEESELPENWSQLVHDLVNLGSGRFCIANKFVLNFGEK
ncbi:unnamed protein product [Miscanthus lutarioriparius]|uniref:Uncharacterized protein n=1 Tax=Miscanthus lutarioriparius TaxID=422564 RepID=A0A811RG60_9POAL|nr:unnamed protein product [Miscanthus lutarioriparius]